MSVKYDIERLIMLIVYGVAIIVGLLIDSRNSLFFIVLPIISFIWTIIETICFVKKRSTFNAQIISDLGNVLLYQLPDLLIICFLKFDQPIGTKIKIFVFILVIVNLIVVFLISKKQYK